MAIQTFANRHLTWYIGGIFHPLILNIYNLKNVYCREQKKIIYQVCEGVFLPWPGLSHLWKHQEVSLLHNLKHNRTLWVDLLYVWNVLTSQIDSICDSLVFWVYLRSQYSYHNTQWNTLTYFKRLKISVIILYKYESLRSKTAKGLV